MPRLIVIRGANHQSHELDGKRTGLGAHEDNQVVISGDKAVSRYHCSIGRKNGVYTVKDQGSRTGTFLNGTRVKERTKLNYGDRLGIGETVAIFVSTGARQKNERAARRLSNLLILQEIAKELNTETEIATLLELIMDTAITLIEADRGFLILVKDDQLEFRVARNIESEVVKSPEFKISNNVIRKVVKSGEPILTTNAGHDLRDFKSIAELSLRSLMCVPLRVKSKVLGTLYLDSQNQGAIPGGQFDAAGLDLLLGFSEQAAIAIENARLLREAKSKEAILSELRVASRIQLQLLPREDPVVPGVAISGHTKPALQVGGDYYDYIWGPNDKNLYVAIGDVSGKGVGAGLVMVMARSILRSLVARGARPRDVLRETNRLLKQDLKPGMFMSMLLATVDGPTGRVLIAGCGHERPLVYRARERRVERIDLGGLVLGVVPDIGEHIEEVQILLGPGDLILLYTDGVTEAVDTESNQFGLERLAGLLERFGGEPPPRLVRIVVEALEHHARGAAQHDDITLIAMSRTAQ